MSIRDKAVTPSPGLVQLDGSGTQLHGLLARGCPQLVELSAVAFSVKAHGDRSDAGRGRQGVEDNEFVRFVGPGHGPAMLFPAFDER